MKKPWTCKPKQTRNPPKVSTLFIDIEQVTQCICIQKTKESQDPTLKLKYCDPSVC